jgi:dethiobiotin synthetase
LAVIFVNRIFFITGTDTGVGKTVLTSLLLQFLRRAKISAFAIKPFCTGDRSDVADLQAAQGNELSDNEVNPFFFSQPVTPAVAAAKSRRRVTLKHALKSIQRVRERCDVLLVEGAGGLLSPLGTGLFSAEDLIQQLRCETIIVTANRLGVLNQAALATRVLRMNRNAGSMQIVLNQAGSVDASTTSNVAVLRRLLAPTRVIEMPHLGNKWKDLARAERSEKNLKNVLATILH